MTPVDVNIGVIVYYIQTTDQFPTLPEVLPAIILDYNPTTYAATIEVFGAETELFDVPQGMVAGNWNYVNNFRE